MTKRNPLYIETKDKFPIGGQKMRIAICEDEAQFAEQLSKYIKEWSDFKNITVFI